MQASSHLAHLIHIGYVDAPRGAHMQNAVRGLRSARRGAGGRFGRREHSSAGKECEGPLESTDERGEPNQVEQASEREARPNVRHHCRVGWAVNK